MEVPSGIAQGVKKIAGKYVRASKIIDMRNFTSSSPRITPSGGENISPLQAMLHVKEAYNPNSLVLTANQAYGLVDLAIDTPWVADAARAEIQDWSNYFFSNSKKPEEYVMGQGLYICSRKDMVTDLLRHHPNSLNPRDGEEAAKKRKEIIRDSLNARINGETFQQRAKEDALATPHLSEDAGDIDATIRKITENAEFSVVGDEIIKNPEQLPLELQFAFGLAGEETIKMIKDRLLKGDKVAFMQVTKLPPDVHNSLRTVIDGFGGSVVDALSYILDNEQKHLDAIPAEKRIVVEHAAIVAREGSKALTHFKILSDESNNDQVEAVEQRVNNILDVNIDIPYAYWRYTLDGFGDDVRVAAGALGFGVGVALVLNAVGFGSEAKTAQEMIKEGIKTGVPTLMADGSMNFAAAFGESAKDKQNVARIKQTFGILAEKYRLPLAIGVASSLGLGVMAKVIEEHTGQQLPASVPLAIAALVPTWLTKLATDRSKRNKDDKHPIHASLMTSSLLAADSTLLVGMLGGLNNALAVTGATEMVEPLAILFLAKRHLDNSKKTYQRAISQNPQDSYKNKMKF